ncbi:MAG: protein kinase [Gemmatimonadetes bacterium]|nr:protein kinase [Gemmatimonadota bacterium]
MDSTADRLQAALAGRYAIEREFGGGGMANVYLAEDLRHHRKVAIKVLPPEVGETLGAARFLREVEVAARLQHPNIVPLLDSGEVGGLCFYVMPYVEGEALRERLAREGALPVAEASSILREVVDALSHAHAHGVVHRDIKPGNIMLSGRHAVVLDFGVSKAVTKATTQQTLTSTGIALGTPAYMAPEQAVADSAQDHRVDIYAVGVVAYEMLTGHPPFAGASVMEMIAAHVTASPEPLERRRPDVPPGLAAVVMKCLAKQPAGRWRTADELLAELDPYATPRGGTDAGFVRAALARRVHSLRRAVSPRRAMLGLAALALITVAVLAVRHQRRVRWARTVVLPQIQRSVEEADWGRAYDLALQTGGLLQGDSLLASLWAALSTATKVESDPPGARVYRRDNTGADTAWAYEGVTPIDSLVLPRSPSYSRLMLVKAGFDTVRDLVAPTAAGWRYEMDSAGTLPPGMVRVAGGPHTLLLWGLDNLSRDVPDFLIGRFEVTNEEFKRFVDAGGYERREFWKFPFVTDDSQETWDEAMSRFHDQTGRPGPATWQVGNYPAGQDNYPVTGVSWYEAAAYAQFAGGVLPTIFHWTRAARINYSAGIVPLSNVDGRHTGPMPVGASDAMGGSGVFDAAGNVREWAFNEAEGHERYILGGGWDDPAYHFNSATVASPFDRSPMNGFRLARYLTPDSTVAATEGAFPLPQRDFRKIPPVSDSVFAAYRRLYDYDAMPLNAVVEETDSSARDWVKQRVTFDAAYGHERVIAYLFLPRNARPPYQTVVYYPGDSNLAVRSSRELLGMAAIDFVIESGRALVYPVYKSTYERGDGLRSSMPEPTNSYRDHVVEWAKDLERSVDYVVSRPDLDSTKLAYYGLSWGGRLAPIMLCVEPRLKVAVLNVAGLRAQMGYPEVEPVYFLPHVKIPVLMLSGRYDFYFNVESSQNPMFDLLGTPPEDKRHVIAEGSHYVPRPVLIKETLDWLDRYLGPVSPSVSVGTAEKKRPAELEGRPPSGLRPAPLPQNVGVAPQGRFLPH